MMIPRLLARHAAAVFAKYPVVTITGPRQSGKTTLARATFADKPYANLENPVTRQFALEDPVAFLGQYPDGAVIDEIQRAPELLSYIQVMVDEQGRNSLFVLTCNWGQTPIPGPQLPLLDGRYTNRPIWRSNLSASL